MELRQLLGSRIRQLRKERGLTQEQLAYTSDAISSKGYLSDIEAGRRAPSVRALEGIAVRLGVEVFDLFVFPDLGLREEVVDLSRSADSHVLEELRLAMSSSGR